MRPPTAGEAKRAPAATGDPKLPPVWDDNYFFAALPTVPQLEGDEAGSDRYGARALAVATETAAETDETGEPRDSSAGTAGAPPRKRRRSAGGAAGAAGTRPRRPSPRADERELRGSLTRRLPSLPGTGGGGPMR